MKKINNKLEPNQFSSSFFMGVKVKVKRMMNLSWDICSIVELTFPLDLTLQSPIPLNSSPHSTSRLHPSWPPTTWPLHLFWVPLDWEGVAPPLPGSTLGYSSTPPKIRTSSIHTFICLLFVWLHVLQGWGKYNCKIQNTKYKIQLVFCILYFESQF